MRRPAPADLLVQALLALLILGPLGLAFLGQGTFQEVFGSGGLGRIAAGSRRVELLAAFVRSSWIGLGAVLVALLIGVPAAWALARHPRTPWRLVLCALPLALAPSTAVTGWLRWGAPGHVASKFAAFPLGVSGLGPLFSMPGVVLILGLGLWPLVAIELWPAFARARGDAYGAALLSGSRLRAFFRVVLPMSLGELAAGALLVFLLASGDFTVSSLLLVRTLPIEVHDYLSAGRSAAAGWAALPLLLLITLAAVLLTRLRRYAWAAECGPDAAPAGTGSPWWPGEILLYAGLGLGYLLPLLGCLDGVLRGEQAFGAALGAGGRNLLDSLRLAGAAAILAMALGALRTACWPEQGTGLLLVASLVLLVVPGSFLASGLLQADLFRQECLGFLGSFGERLNRFVPPELILAIGYAVRFLYLPLRLSEEGLRSLDPALLESAELSGHGRLHRGLGVAVPLSWRHLLASGVLVFILALGELPMADKLAPPGVRPASVWLFERQHQGYDEEVFAISLLLGLAALLVLGFCLAARGGLAWRERRAGRL